MSDLDQTQRLLRMVPLFNDCSDDDLAKLADRMTELDFNVGEELVREGDRAESFMVIISGTAVVQQGGRDLATMGPGNFLGELGLMFDIRRTATVKATSPLRAVVADRTEFNRLTTEVPGLVERVSNSAAYLSATTNLPS